MSGMIGNLTIGQVCEAIDIKPHTLRYWDRILGLDIKRDNLSNRCYSLEDIEKLKTIKYLRKEKGLNYKAIKASIKTQENLSLFNSNELLIESLVANDNLIFFMNLLTTTLDHSIEKKIETKLNTIISKLDEIKNMELDLKREFVLHQQENTSIYERLEDKLNIIISNFIDIKDKDIDLKRKLEIQQENHYRKLDEKITRWRERQIKIKKKSFINRILNK